MRAGGLGGGGPRRAVLRSGVRPPGRTVLHVLIAFNALVFVLWLLSGGSPRLEAFMVDNFLFSRAHLAEGHFWTVLTAAFSHSELWHLALNMMVLYSFGDVLISRWGPRPFVLFYLAAAVVSSLADAVVGWLIARDNPALGASGAVSAVLAAFAFFYPRHRLLVFGIVPLPAWLAVSCFVGLDLWGVFAQKAGGGLPIGHGAHLGGAAFGLGYAVLREGARAPLDSGAELARLLTKLQTEGPESLTPEERAALEPLLRGRADGS